MMDDDKLDGCEIDFTQEDQISADDDLAALVLFADVQFDDPTEVERRTAEWKALFA